MSDREPTTDADVRVEVWTRDASPPPDDPRATVLARLRELESEGVVDDLSVRVWGKFVPATDEHDNPNASGGAEESGEFDESNATDGSGSPGEPDGSDPPARERVAAFRRWADRDGHSLEPAFERCERSSMVSEEVTDAIRLPLQCLAVYGGDRLVGVFPCSTEDGNNTVRDCLERLETGGLVGDSSGE